MRVKYPFPGTFALAELSVVLICVGLLSGVIVIGKDMMHAAQVRRFISTTGDIATAASTFQLKFRQLPGDLRAVEAQQFGFVARSGDAGHGDGNGLLESCEQGGFGLGCETALFWRDLADANLAQSPKMARDDYVDGMKANFVIEDYVPITPFRESTNLLIYPYNAQNSFFVGRVTSVNARGALTMAPGLTVDEAYMIDEKTDDGAPSGGRVVAMQDMLTPDAGARASEPGTCVVNTVLPMTYNLDKAYRDHVTCQLSIRMAR